MQSIGAGAKSARILAQQSRDKKPWPHRAAMIVIQAIRDLFADVLHHLKAEAAGRGGYFIERVPRRLVADVLHHFQAETGEGVVALLATEQTHLGDAERLEDLRTDANPT